MPPSSTPPTFHRLSGACLSLDGCYAVMASDMTRSPPASTLPRGGQSRELLSADASSPLRGHGGDALHRRLSGAWEPYSSQQMCARASLSKGVCVFLCACIGVFQAKHLGRCEEEASLRRGGTSLEDMIPPLRTLTATNATAVRMAMPGTLPRTPSYAKKVGALPSVVLFSDEFRTTRYNT